MSCFDIPCQNIRGHYGSEILCHVSSFVLFTHVCFLHLLAWPSSLHIPGLFLPSTLHVTSRCPRLCFVFDLPYSRGLLCLYSTFCCIMYQVFCCFFPGDIFRLFLLINHVGFVISVLGSGFYPLCSNRLSDISIRSLKAFVTFLRSLFKQNIRNINKIQL